MVNFNLYIGTVVTDTDITHIDKKKLGRVQVRIVPELNEILDADLPWAKPFIGPSSTTHAVCEVPKKGESVWIFSFASNYRDLRYLPGLFFENFLDVNTIESKLSSITTLDPGKYPDTQFQSLDDGTVFIRNRLNGDIGVLHSSGTLITINAAGLVTVKAKTVNVEGENVEVKGQVVNITGGELNTKGSAAPDPAQGGPFCAIPQCLYAGSPHIGNKVSGT